MTAGCNFHNQLLFTACCLITVGWIKANRVSCLPILFGPLTVVWLVAQSNLDKTYNCINVSQFITHKFMSPINSYLAFLSYYRRHTKCRSVWQRWSCDPRSLYLLWPEAFTWESRVKSGCGSLQGLRFTQFSTTCWDGGWRAGEVSYHMFAMTG